MLGEGDGVSSALNSSELVSDSVAMVGLEGGNECSWGFSRYLGITEFMD